MTYETQKYEYRYNGDVNSFCKRSNISNIWNPSDRTKRRYTKKTKHDGSMKMHPLLWHQKHVVFMLTVLVTQKISKFLFVAAFHLHDLPLRYSARIKPSASLDLFLRYHERKMHVVSSIASLVMTANGSKQRQQAATVCGSNLSSEDAFDLERFQRRRQQQRNMDSNDTTSTTTTSLQPKEVVVSILEALRSVPHYYDFDPYKPNKQHPGVAMLWHCSTYSWQRTLATMVGGRRDSRTKDNSTAVEKFTDNNNLRASNQISKCSKFNKIFSLEEQIIPALGRLFSRPKQQFAILMGIENSNYMIEFPTEVVEWSDDEVWFECRLRDKYHDTLLVVLGWTMLRKQQMQYSNIIDDYDIDDVNNNSNNQNNNFYSWYIHSIEWQDFRDEYRPGIGREEWERICG
jgi:hypothetical protein